MKGQYLTVEYVLFFAIGIAMVIGIYMTFININEEIRTGAVTMQLGKTGEYIRDHIVIIYEAGRRTDSKITYHLKVPSQLSGHIYVLKYSNGLNINSTQNYKIGDVLSLYNININSPNIIYSTNGVINIQYENNQVWLS